MGTRKFIEILCKKGKEKKRKINSGQTAEHKACLAKTSFKEIKNRLTSYSHSLLINFIDFAKKTASIQPAFVRFTEYDEVTIFTIAAQNSSWKDRLIKEKLTQQMYLLLEMKFS